MKKLVLKCSLLLVGLLLIVGMVHAFAFPQLTRCVLIDFYDFEKEGALYYRKETPPDQLMKLKHYISIAESRVDSFWRERTSYPKYIYCHSEEDYLKFGVPFLSPAAANMRIHTYVIVHSSGVDSNILSHELSHTELFHRLGTFNRLKIPTWFDEGLAMQVDHRDYYSIDTLAQKSNHFRQLPDVKSMKTYSDFGKGSRAEIMLNYMTSKYVVQRWYSNEKLMTLIEQVNNGSSFEEAFQETQKPNKPI